MGVYNKDKDNTETRINSISTFPEFEEAVNVDPFFSPIHDTIKSTANYANSALGFVKELNSLVNDGMNGFVDGLSSSRGYTRPNEYVTKGIPDVDMFQKCTERDGLQAWDTQGYWHCLFPRGNNPVKGLPYKEDIENDDDHKHGLFFTNLSDMYNWQSQMRQNVKQKTRGFSKETQTFIKTLPNGDVEKRTIHRETDSDGNTKEWEENVVLDADGNKK